MAKPSKAAPLARHLHETKPMTVAELDQARVWPECKPLQRELPPPEEFPIEALGPILGPAARRAHEVIRAPLALCAISFLAAANLAVQAHADVEIDGRVSPVSEFFVTVAESGARKSATDSEALNQHRKWEEANCIAYEAERKIYEDELEVYKAAREAIKRSKRTQDEKNKELERLKVPIEPLDPVFILAEPTYEGLVKKLARGLPSVGLFSDEGGRFIGGHAMSKENWLKTAAGFSEIYDRGCFDRIRAGDGIAKHYGKRLAMHLMIQPDVSNLLLGNRGLKDQGFLSRCLVVRPPYQEKVYQAVDLSQEFAIRVYRSHVKQILERRLPLSQEQKNSLKPRRLQLSIPAKELYAQFHDQIQKQVAPGEKLSAIRGFGNKAHDHAARLAATLALFEDIECHEISESNYEAGRLIVLHCMGELMRLIDVAAVDYTLLEAEEVLKWLHEKGKKAISLVELYKVGPNFVRSASKAREMMDVLSHHGYVQPCENGLFYEGVLRQEAFEVRPDELA